MNAGESCTVVLMDLSTCRRPVDTAPAGRRVTLSWAPFDVDRPIGVDEQT